MTPKARHIILGLLCLAFSFLKAQRDLIPNPGFEDTLYCNVAGGSIASFKSWYNPTLNYTFARHACNSSMSNFMKPRYGYGCVAGYTYYFGTGEQFDYLANKFSDTLKAGHVYCFSFHIKLDPVFKHGSNNLGVFIENTHIFYNTFFLAPATPDYTIPFTIIDTTYQQIAFTYTATGGETDFMVGGYMPYGMANYPVSFPLSPQNGSFFVYDDFSMVDGSAPDLGNDRTICDASDSLLIGESSWFGTNYQWYANGSLLNTNDGQIKVKPNTTTTYVLKKSNCLSTSDTIVITVASECPVFNDDALVIPNVFTPNEDKKNDTWELQLPLGATFKSFAIFNRWGNLIFQPENRKQSVLIWDGRTSSGEPCNEGTYFYTINYSNAKGESIEKKGFISLYR